MGVTELIKELRAESGAAEIDADRFNERIRVIRYDGQITALIPAVLAEAKQEGAQKVIFFAKRGDEPEFVKHLFIVEGVIDGYYNGHEAVVMARYLSEERRRSDSYVSEDSTVDCLYETPRRGLTQTESTLMFRKADEDDADCLSHLYKHVFLTYPTPVFNPLYIKKTMKENTIYYAAFDQDRLIGAASADINPVLGHAEMTDCAVLSDYRGNSVTAHLFKALEQELAGRGIIHLFSLARAASYGMNAVLYHAGYGYRGRLVNNCRISEGLENMNIWCKTLRLAIHKEEFV
ncbi:putative beta-lysine N-acetyltransferase [Bacillus amyloliquefaciens]|uniref:putative beta-lysine N-acetyltransferase n=1 Tax=Bacillus amyloliquefaciens group TaxID=1938374 RepID=UPI00159732E3|nr:putative beta-lysine N-acetyltransferase [Bacillus velezensis]MDV5127150.1 putative beta-lysine N-acetyltransferase [Bacillus velezensis]QKF35575.1 putative beta-lysine N-acetyltransferase [Bacillus velezensis]